MKLHHLRDFVAVAQEKSIGAAARSLNRPQPALSRSLRELERELDVPLIERHADGVSLTSAGAHFIVRATSILEELRRGVEEAAQLRASYNGTLRVALSPVVQATLLAEVFPKFRRKFPDVQLQVLEALFPRIENALYDGTLDMYVGPRPSRPIDRRYQINMMWKSERVVTARRKHPRGNARHLSELVDQEWVVIGLHHHPVTELEEVFGSLSLPTPARYTTVNSILAALTLMMVADAFFLIPRFCLRSDPFVDSIAAVPLEMTLTGPDIVQIHRAGIPLTPVAEQFSDLLHRAATHLLDANRGGK